MFHEYDGNIQKIKAFSDKQFKSIIEELDKRNYKYDVLDSNPNAFFIRVYYKNGDYTRFESSDDPREGYIMIEGKVQNYLDWLNGGY